MPLKYFSENATRKLIVNCYNCSLIIYLSKFSRRSQWRFTFECDQSRTKMLSVKILLVLFLARNVVSVERIVGGQIAEPHSIPYQVALFIKRSPTNVLLCGGSLINEKTVLTAAHCLHSNDKAVVIIGAHNISGTEEGVEIKRVNSSNYKIHPEFNIKYAKVDIALIILPTPVTFSSQIKPVQLPSKAFTGESFAGDVGTVSGFGLTCDGCGSSQVLRFTTNRVLNSDECSESYPFASFPSETQVCVATSDNNSGNCRGDSGGPLTVTRNGTAVQIGLSSFGHYKCQEGLPTVFTRLTPELVQWIEEMSEKQWKVLIESFYFIV